MTKSEFATRLLFWLLPWPISRALPKALRIFYFAPDGVPPPDWEPGPPPPPDWNPDPNSPYLPGPGPGYPWPQPGSSICETNCDDTFWTPSLGLWIAAQNVWWPEDDGDGMPTVQLTELGTWVEAFRPTYLRITTGGPATTFVVFLTDAVGHELGSSLTYTSGTRLLLSWLADDIDYMLIRTEPPVDFYVTNIELF